MTAHPSIGRTTVRRTSAHKTPNLLEEPKRCQKGRSSKGGHNCTFSITITMTHDESFSSCFSFLDSSPDWYVSWSSPANKTGPLQKVKVMGHFRWPWETTWQDKESKQNQWHQSNKKEKSRKRDTKACCATMNYLWQTKDFRDVSRRRRRRRHFSPAPRPAGVIFGG